MNQIFDRLHPQNSNDFVDISSVTINNNNEWNYHFPVASWSMFRRLRCRPKCRAPNCIEILLKSGGGVKEKRKENVARLRQPISIMIQFKVWFVKKKNKKEKREKQIKTKNKNYQSKN